MLHTCKAFVILILWRLFRRGDSCSSVSDTIRATVEPLEHMSWQKSKRGTAIHIIVSKCIRRSLSGNLSPSIFYPSLTFTSSISPSLFLSLSFPPLSSLTTAYPPHTRANRNFHSRLTTQPGHSGKWEHAARMQTLGEALWIFKCWQLHSLIFKTQRVC